MCGIAGFVGKGDSGTGNEMIRCIQYRGPDYQGVFYKDGVGLAHARLSIIDVDSRSNQPFFSDDRSVAIVFNGEIYNFPEIKIELAKTGKYHFHTSSDTEVLINAYLEYGKDCVKKIHGMFAFAIYDFRSGELFLAKDRLGKKPLFYTVTPDGTFVFASELKAVLKHPSVKKELNTEAVNQYLTFDYVPTPNTICKGVSKLDPAHCLVFQNGKIASKYPYWEHNFRTNESLTFEQAMSGLDEHLNNATRDRLMSDVPLGVFLSGGLDSSTVAYYAQKNSASKIRTFSIGFEDKSYDEQDYALQVAKHLGTEHEMQVLTPQKTIDLIDDIFVNLDEPFADASIIPTYYLSAFTRQYVTVALGGDGSDELMAGYPTFQSDKFKGLSRIFHGNTLSLMQSVVGLLPANDKNISFDFKVKQFFRGFSAGQNHIHQLWLGSFLPDEKQKLFRKDVFETLNDTSGLKIIDQYFNDSIPTQFDKVTNFYYKMYLLDDILVKVDRASMYNSLEVRAPFLDTRVVEFLNSLPRKFKQNGFEGKHILKKLMNGKLPDNIITRPKKGFGIPLSDWIRKDLKALIHDTLVSEDDLFNKQYIEDLLTQHYSGKYNHRKLIWNLFVLKKVLRDQGYSKL